MALILNEEQQSLKDIAKEFLQNNSLDVSEVKFSKDLKPTKELQKVIDDFERKYFDQADLGRNIEGVGVETGRPNYDLYRIAFGDEAGTMDFQTLRTILGNNVSPENFKTLPNGKLTLSNIRDFTSGMMTEDAARFKGFQIDPIEIDPFLVFERRTVEG